MKKTIVFITLIIFLILALQPAEGSYRYNPLVYPQKLDYYLATSEWTAVKATFDIVHATSINVGVSPIARISTNGNDLIFYDINTGTKTLAQLAAGGGGESTTVSDTTTLDLTMTGTDIKGDVNDVFLKNNASDTTTGIITATGFITTGTATSDVVNANSRIDIGTGSFATIGKDASANLYLNDTVTGTKTLAQLAAGGAGGAPTDADYLVGTANGSLSAEIVVGTTPGGSLGGTWGTPTIDDLFLKNDASDTTTGTITAAGFTTTTGTATSNVVDTHYIDYSSGGAVEVRDNLIATKLSLTNTTLSFDDITTSNPAFTLQSTYAGATEDLSYWFVAPAGKYLDLTISSDGGAGSWTPYVYIGSSSLYGSYIQTNQMLNLFAGTSGTSIFDTDDYIQYRVVSNVPEITSIGGSDFKITSDSGNINFDNENLKTTGTATSNVVDTHYLEYSSGGVVEVRDGLTVNGTTTVGNVLGIIDFGSATSFEIWNGTADVALGSAGQMHLNTTDEQLSFHSAADGEISGEVSISLIYHISVSFDPDAICDGDVDRVFLFTIGDDFPEGITIDEWKFSFEADPATEADIDLKYADAFIGVANAAVIDILDTLVGVSSEDTDANINGGAVVANGKVMYLEFGTAYTTTGHQCIFELFFHAEED